MHLPPRACRLEAGVFAAELRVLEGERTLGAAGATEHNGSLLQDGRTSERPCVRGVQDDQALELDAAAAQAALGSLGSGELLGHFSPA